MKSCPFCGSLRTKVKPDQTASDAAAGRLTRDPPAVVCLDCFAIGPSVLARGARERLMAVELWDERNGDT